MRHYILARLAWAGPIVLAIVIVTFLIIHIVPGDPIQALVGDFPTPPGYIEKVRKDFGLDQPLTTQLWLYLTNLAQGNLGFSFSNRQPVLGLVLDRAQYTLLIMIPALSLAAILGIAMALAAAPRAGGLFDSGITALSVAGFSIPIFWLGQILVIAFAIQLPWLPAQGMVSARQSLEGWARAGISSRRVSQRSAATTTSDAANRPHREWPGPPGPDHRLRGRRVECAAPRCDSSTHPSSTPGPMMS